MRNLSDIEREFLEHGGIIWCVHLCVPGAWHVVKQSWEGEEILEVISSTEEEAIRWVYLLADLANPDDNMAIHHDIPRGCGHARYPILIPSSRTINTVIGVASPTVSEPMGQWLHDDVETL